MILISAFLVGSVPALAADSGENLAETKQPSSIDRHDSGTRHVAASIRSGVSFYLSATQAGIPVDVLLDMIHIFEHKIDFQRGFHPGDSFEVYYEAKSGIIRYTMISVSGDEIAFYRYQFQPNSAPLYFDATGHSANGKMVLSSAELPSFRDAMRKIRATVAASRLNHSN